MNDSSNGVAGGLMVVGLCFLLIPVIGVPLIIIGALIFAGNINASLEARKVEKRRRAMRREMGYKPWEM